jgi:Zn-finger protein
MDYRSWYEQHGAKHREIVDRLVEQGLSDDEIIDYFDFENMLDAEPGFCYLYKERKKCHDVESLNCYLCACPLFRFSDEGLRRENGRTVYSECAIDCKHGAQFVYGDAVHQDCSNCFVPHARAYVRRNFDRDWFVAMQGCDLIDVVNIDDFGKSADGAAPDAEAGS